MEYLKHITREGERWDSLAWRYYGDAMRYAPIVAANPHVPMAPMLPAGEVLAIPRLEDAPRIEDMPPWMR